jgi:hypothetical protein
MENKNKYTETNLNLQDILHVIKCLFDFIQYQELKDLRKGIILYQNLLDRIENQREANR